MKGKPAVPKKKSEEEAGAGPGKEQLMKPAELAQYRKALLEKHRDLTGSVDALEQSALKKSRQENSGDLSNMPIHMADIGSDNYEQEFNLGLIESEDQVLREIEEALDRIEEGTFGTCEECGKPIKKARLKAVPHAKFCIDCKREEEEGGL
jgi:DnaK suppressor protein